MMIPLAYTNYSGTTTPSSIYIDVSCTIRLYETGVADLTLLIHGIVASGQCKLTPGTQAIPASTVLTNRANPSSRATPIPEDTPPNKAVLKLHSGLRKAEICILV
jgi:hypothetical protein